jgi:predicted RNase H-like HicB family nuclease
MSERKYFTVRVARSGGWWAISVIGLPGVHSQARRLRQVPAMAREAISLVLEVPDDSFDFDVVHDLPPEVQAMIDDAAAKRKTAEEAEQAAAEVWRALARTLIGDGYTVRDAGDVLGISPQRVSQLVNS